MLTSAHHRHCFLLKGDLAQVLADFLQLSAHLKTPLIAAYDVSDYDALNTGQFATRCFKQARQELGRSHEAILVDLTQGVSASALAILSGTVRGGGLFAIALPKDNWLSLPDQDLARHLPWPYEPQQIDSSFKRFLLTQLDSQSSPFLTLSAEHHSSLSALPPILNKAPLTQEQRDVQATLSQQQANAYLLIAPRGRGKSTLLGDSLANLLMTGKKVAISAPNQHAISTLKHRFQQVLGQNDQAIDLPFFAPDALLLDNRQWDWLLVDEAAMIPVPLLMSLHKKATYCVFSTTDYGYEGAGKGFGIRFCRYLAEQAARVDTLRLSKPIRWGENDPLENWINACLLLAPDNSSIAARNAPSPTQTTPVLEFQKVVGRAWLEQPERLNHAFQLLVSAHYQTSADNLRWLLDDPSVFTYLAQQKQNLMGLAIITQEGRLPRELSQAVLEGKRRPRGHLIPQSLLAHEGINKAGDYLYWRISRIATQYQEQNKGVGSQLLKQIESDARGQCDLLSTSFAATSDVLGFWLKNGYVAVRLGTSKDQASGCYSLMMVKPLSDAAKHEARIWQQDFIERFLTNLLLQYRDLPSELIILILHSANKKAFPPALIRLSQHDQDDLQLFIHHHRPLDSIRAVFLKAVLCLALNAQLDPNIPLHTLILDAALGKATKTRQEQAKITGKKAMHQAFKSLLKASFPCPA